MISQIVRATDLSFVTGGLTSMNTRCFYQQQGVPNNAETSFACPSPGLVGSIVTVQNLGNRLEVLEIEVLGILGFTWLGNKERGVMEKVLFSFLQYCSRQYWMGSINCIKLFFALFTLLWAVHTVN